MSINKKSPIHLIFIFTYFIAAVLTLIPFETASKVEKSGRRSGGGNK